MIINKKIYFSFITICVFILLILRIFQSSGPSENDKKIINKIVRLSGNVQAEGIVNDYRKGKYIIIAPILGNDVTPIRYVINNTTTITIIADSYEDLLKKEQERDVRLENQISKLNQSKHEQPEENTTNNQLQNKPDFNSELDIQRNREENSNVYLAQGLYYFAIENLKQSFDCIQNAVNLNPNSPKGFFFIGLIHLAWKDSSSAIQAFNNAIAINRADHESFFFRGLALILSDQKKLAVKDFEEANKYNSLFSRLSKPNRENGRYAIPGGEIRSSTQKGSIKPKGKITIENKEQEYTPAEGGGFLTSVPLSNAEIRESIYQFATHTTEKETWEIIFSIYSTIRYQLLHEFEYQQKKSKCLFDSVRPLINISYIGSWKVLNCIMQSSIQRYLCSDCIASCINFGEVVSFE